MKDELRTCREMGRFAVSVFLVVWASSSLGFGGETVMEKRIEMKGDVVAGKATTSQVEQGHKNPNALAIADPVGDGNVVVAIGDSVPVEPQHEYLLRAWMRPETMIGWHANLAVEWLDAQGKTHGDIVAAVVYTARSKPHVGEPVNPIWMPFTVTGTAPKDTARARVVLRIRTSHDAPPQKPCEWGRLLIDQVSVTRTPRIEITTREPGNLVIEGNAFPVHVRISDVPEGMHEGALAVNIHDANDQRVAAFEDRIGKQGIEKDCSFDLGRGYYEIRWTLNAGDAFSREGSVSAGVIPDPAKNTAGYATPFALDAGFSWFYVNRGDDVLKLAAEVARRGGFKHLRERLSSNVVAPQPDRYEWGDYLKSAKAQHDAGMQILEIMHSWPPWIAKDHAGPPKDLNGVYQFFKRAATDLGEYIPFWEPWNEADIFFFQGRPEEYAGVQKAAYLGVLAANPNLKVTSCSTSGGSVKWFQDTLDNGIKDYFDILNTHYYGPVDGLIKRLERDRNINDGYGVTQPYWLTEMGTICYWDETGTYRASELLQAPYLVKSYIYALSFGIERYYHFYMAEFLESDRDLWGICRYDLTPKPAFVAFANLIGTLDQGEYLGQLDLKDASGYVFNNGKERVVVAWANTPVAVNIKGTALDLFGHPTDPKTILPSTPSTPSTPSELRPLGPAPIFILGAEIPDGALIHRPQPKPPYIRPDTQSLSLVQMLCGEVENDFPLGDNRRKQPIRIQEGHPLDLRLTLCNFSDEPVTVRSEWEIPKGWKCEGRNKQTVALQPGQERILTRRAIPRKLDHPEYTITVRSTAPHRTIAPVVLRLARTTHEP